MKVSDKFCLDRLQQSWFDEIERVRVAKLQSELQNIAWHFTNIVIVQVESNSKFHLK